MYKAYIFDFDYTLANSEKGIVMCFERLFADEGYGPFPKDVIRRTIGMTMYDAMAQLTGETDSSKIKSLINLYKIRYSDVLMTANTRLYDDTIPVLTHLKKNGALCCIVSTKTRSRISETLQRDGIESLIDCIIGFEDVTEPKPSGEGIHLILHHFDLAHNDVLYIGDSLIDMDTARAAGVNFAAVTTGMTTVADFTAAGQYRILQNLSELI